MDWLRLNKAKSKKCFDEMNEKKILILIAMKVMMNLKEIF